MIDYRGLCVITEVDLNPVPWCSWAACHQVPEEAHYLVLTPPTSVTTCNGPGNLPTVSRAGFLQVRKVMTVWEQLGLLCCPAHLWLTISAVAGQGIGSHSPLRYLREAACERKGTVLALGTLSLKSNLSLFVAVSSWLRYLTSLNLVFLMCNIGLKNLSALQGCLHRFRHVCK